MSGALSIFAVVACGALALPARSAPPAGGAYASCQTRAGGVEPALKVCAAAEIDRRDALLNVSYQRLFGRVDALRRPKLRAAERAWLSFRDTECDFRMSVEAGGSNAALLYSTCRLELTALRIEDLGQALEVENF